MPRGVYKHKSGYKRDSFSDVWRANLSKALKGRRAWNKGIKTGPNPQMSARMSGKAPWNKGVKTGPNHEHSKRMKGRPAWNKGVCGEQSHMYGLKRTPDEIEKSAAKRRGVPRPDKAGENNPLWKGGITPINAKIRTSLEYKNWRRAVFQRDDYTCQICSVRGVILHADHIKPFAYFPELRFDINNGRTLCKECHKKTDTYLTSCPLLTAFKRGKITLDTIS